jgi:hypothetical protein
MPFWLAHTFDFTLLHVEAIPAFVDRAIREDLLASVVNKTFLS